MEEPTSEERPLEVYYDCGTEPGSDSQVSPDAGVAPAEVQFAGHPQNWQPDAPGSPDWRFSLVSGWFAAVKEWSKLPREEYERIFDCYRLALLALMVVAPSVALLLYLHQ